MGPSTERDEISEDERTAQRPTLELARKRVAGNAPHAEAERAFSRAGLAALTPLVVTYTATCVTLNAFAVPAPPLNRPN